MRGTQTVVDIAIRTVTLLEWLQMWEYTKMQCMCSTDTQLLLNDGWAQELMAEMTHFCLLLPGVLSARCCNFIDQATVISNVKQTKKQTKCIKLSNIPTVTIQQFKLLPAIVVNKQRMKIRTYALVDKQQNVKLGQVE